LLWLSECGGDRGSDIGIASAKSLFSGLGGGGAFSQLPSLHLITVPFGAQSDGSKKEPSTMVKSRASSPPRPAGGLSGRNAVKASPVNTIPSTPGWDCSSSPTLSPDERAAIEQTLSESAVVGAVEAVSKEDALRRFTQNFGTVAEAAGDLPTNPLPASVEVRLRPGANPSEVASLAQTAAGLAGVADVRYDRQWIERLMYAVDVVRAGGFALAALLVCAAALTVASVVRLALFARREEIHIMQLVGAPIAYIRGPFVVEGLIQGGIGAIAALVVLWITFVVVRSRADAWLAGADPSPFSIPPGGGPRFAFPRVAPGSLEEALDRVEALAEWAGAVSGSPASEGGLWKSIRAHAARRSLLDALAERVARETAFLAPEERRDIVRAGIFLPPEAHSRLLSSILGIDPEPAALSAEGERGDPLLVLAKRLM